MYQITKFGIYTLPNYDTITDIGPGDTRVRIHDLPEGGGYDEQGVYDHATPGAQIITKSCTAQYDSELDMLTAMRDIRYLSGVQETLVRKVIATGDEEWCKARCKKIDMIRKSGDKYMLSMTFHFVKLSPVWYGDSHLESYALNANSSTQIVVPNHGNAPVDNALITIDPLDRTINSITIRHNATPSGSTFDELIYTGTLAPGQQLEIDCAAYTVKKGGVDDYQNFQLGPLHREVPWFRLWGTAFNYVTVILASTGGSLSPAITFSYSEGLK